MFTRCDHAPVACTIGDMNDTNHPMSDPKIEAIQRLYGAFGRHDVGAVVRQLPRQARSARFFQALGPSVEVTEFTPLSFTSNETDVMARCSRNPPGTPRVDRRRHRSARLIGYPYRPKHSALLMATSSRRTR